MQHTSRIQNLIIKSTFHLLIWQASGTLKCTSAGDLILLLKSSEFIAHDLTVPYEGCTDASGASGETVDGTEGGTEGGNTAGNTAGNEAGNEAESCNAAALPMSLVRPL